jgi:hypothetical protein
VASGENICRALGRENRIVYWKLKQLTDGNPNSPLMWAKELNKTLICSNKIFKILIFSPVT